MAIKRRLQGYGYSRLICLPKYWVEQQNFKKGNLIEMSITLSGNLILRGKNEDKQTA